MKMYSIYILFSSGRDVSFVSTLTEDEVTTITEEFRIIMALNSIIHFNIEEIPLPNLGLIEFIEDDE